MKKDEELKKPKKVGKKELLLNKKELYKDQEYVIKEIDTEMMPKQQALEAMMEIELMAEINSEYIVAYYDSFIEGSKINIIMECCHHGNLQALVKKQGKKPF
jgi:serine/threonine protein kinase